jgi:hypothetical protein
MSGLKPRLFALCAFDILHASSQGFAASHANGIPVPPTISEGANASQLILVKAYCWNEKYAHLSKWIVSLKIFMTANTAAY